MRWPWSGPLPARDRTQAEFSLHQGGDESPLDETSPYYSEIHIAGGHGNIPLQGGYFEIAIRAKLLEGNPEEITLRWIDFFRN